MARQVLPPVPEFTHEFLPYGCDSRPLKNVPFCPISETDSKFNPRNLPYIPAVKFFVFLELESRLKAGTFFKGLRSLTRINIIQLGVAPVDKFKYDGVMAVPMTNLTIRINLNLSRHCIETAIRRRYNRCLSRSFKTRSLDKDLKREINLLKTALESLDFSYLRSTWAELAGHGKAVVTLGWDRRHRIGILVNGHPIEFIDQPASGSTGEPTDRPAG